MYGSCRQMCFTVSLDRSVGKIDRRSSVRGEKKFSYFLERIAF